MNQLDLKSVMSAMVGALPGAGAMAFDDQLRIVAIAGAHLVAADVDADRYAGMLVADALGRERWETLEPLFRSALEGQAAWIEIADGGARRRIDVSPVTGEGGGAVGGICLSHEMSDREVLLAELDQQRQLLELAHDAIIVREASSSAVVYWNREAEEVYGYSAAEVRGRVTHDLLATEFPQPREAVDEQLLTTGRWDGHLWHTRADGTRILVLSRQALVRRADGEPVAIIELNSDVTEQANAVQALREAEQQFRGLVESAPDATVIVDERGEIVLANARAEQLLGYSREELVGESVDMLLPRGLWRPHLIPRGDDLTSAPARELSAGIDLMARRKDGGEFLAEIRFSPLRTDSGTLISAAIRDVGKQQLRQLEQALVPRMKIDPRWSLAWRYRPSLNSMLLGGDFIGVADRPDGSLSLCIGDVTGHGPVAAGTGAMLRAAWLGAVQAGVALEAIPAMLNRLLVDQADPEAARLATVCLVEVDPRGSQLCLIRAGHDAPLLITPDAVTPLNRAHGAALGLAASSTWPTHIARLPADSALMLFTDGLTERRSVVAPIRLGFDQLVPQIDAEAMLGQPPDRAIDEMLARLFPQGTDALEDDLAVILLSLRDSELAQLVEAPLVSGLRG